MKKHASKARFFVAGNYGFQVETLNPIIKVIRKDWFMKVS